MTVSTESALFVPIRPLGPRLIQPVTYSLVVDGVAYVYTLPSTGGQYAKKGIWLQTVKGLTFQHGMQGGPFQLFDQDCEFWVSQWGTGGGYVVVNASGVAEIVALA